MNKNFSKLEYISFSVNDELFNFAAVNEDVKDAVDKFPYKKDYLSSYPEHKKKYSVWMKENHPDSLANKDPKELKVADKALAKDVQTMMKLAEKVNKSDNPNSVKSKLGRILTSKGAKIFYGLAGTAAAAVLGYYAGKHLSPLAMQGINAVKGKYEGWRNGTGMTNQELDEFKSSERNERAETLRRAAERRANNKINNEKMDEMAGKKSEAESRIKLAQEKVDQAQKKYDSADKINKNAYLSYNNRREEVRTSRAEYERLHELYLTQKDQYNKIKDDSSIRPEIREKARSNWDNIAKKSGEAKKEYDYRSNLLKEALPRWRKTHDAKQKALAELDAAKKELDQARDYLSGLKDSGEIIG